MGRHGHVQVYEGLDDDLHGLDLHGVSDDGGGAGLRGWHTQSLGTSHAPRPCSPQRGADASASRSWTASVNVGVGTRMGGAPFPTRPYRGGVVSPLVCAVSDAGANPTHLGASGRFSRTAGGAGRSWYLEEKQPIARSDESVKVYRAVGRSDTALQGGSLGTIHILHALLPPR